MELFRGVTASARPFPRCVPRKTLPSAARRSVWLPGVLMILECQLDAGLDNARVRSRIAHLTECAVVRVRDRSLEARVIHRVQELSLDSQADPFRQLHFLRNGDVPIVDAVVA